MDGILIQDTLGPELDAAIDAAASYEDLDRRVTEAYANHDPTVLSRRVADALVLAELAALRGIVEDYPATELIKMEGGADDPPKKRPWWWKIPKRSFEAAVEAFDLYLDRVIEIPVVYAFGERPAKRAPLLAAAIQLDTTAKVRGIARKAKKDSVPLEDTKSDLKALLREIGVDSDPVKVNPIADEEKQSRFASTRETLLSLDFYRAAYPFWRYTATLDERTTAGCRALHGLTMPASDPRWRGYVPPRHWNCRSHVLAVVHSDGMQATKTEPDPQYEGQGSFGTLVDEWEPRPGSYPPDLWEIYAKAKGIEYPHLVVPGRWWTKKEG